MKKSHIQLSATEQKELEQLVAKGELSVRVIKRALALLALDRGETMTSIAKHQQVTNNTVTAWRKKYLEAGLKGLYDSHALAVPCESMGCNAPRSQPSLVVNRPQVTGNGACGC